MLQISATFYHRTSRLTVASSSPPHPYTGPWIEQFIASVMVVVTFRLALRGIDFFFVLHMKNVTGSLFSGTSPSELRALVRAYSKKGTEIETGLDDAEQGKRTKRSGCFGKPRTPKNVYESKHDDAYSDVKLDPEVDKAFENRAVHFVKVRADLERERLHLKKEIEHALVTQTNKRQTARTEKSREKNAAHEEKKAWHSTNAFSILKSTPERSPLPSPMSSPMTSPRGARAPDAPVVGTQSTPGDNSDSAPAGDSDKTFKSLSEKSAERKEAKQSKAMDILKAAPSPSMEDRGYFAPPSPGPKSPSVSATMMSPASPTGSDFATAKSPVTTQTKAKVEDSALVDAADVARVRLAKDLEKRLTALHLEQKALATEIFNARKARYEQDQKQWILDKKRDNSQMELLASSPNSAMMLSAKPGNAQDSVEDVSGGTASKSASQASIEDSIKSTRRHNGDFDGFSDAHVVLILRRFAKGIVAYLFLAWFLKVWNADLTFFVAASAVGFLVVLLSLREGTYWGFPKSRLPVCRLSARNYVIHIARKTDAFFSSSEAALNVIGACVIVFYKLFVVGDWIKIECEGMNRPLREGVVRDINFFFTTVTRVEDMTDMRIPNAHFVRRSVINVSRQHTFRHEFVIPTSYVKAGNGSMDATRAFMNDAKKRVERVGEVKNVWVFLDPEPLGAGGSERRIKVRFDFAHGPASPANMNDPKPLSVAGIECRAWRSWLNFLVVRDDAMTAAIDAADTAAGVALGAATENPASTGAGGTIRKLEITHPKGGTNEGGYDAQFNATQRQWRDKGKAAETQ